MADNDQGIATVFFDLGDTLGVASVGGTPRRLVGFDLFGFTLGLLRDLKSRGLRLGVISNTGTEGAVAVNAILQPTGVLADLDPALLVYSADEGVTKASPEIFRRAADRAGFATTPERCLYVGEDAAERVVAVSAGWQVCSHPLMVAEVLDGQALRFVRLTVPTNQASDPWRDDLRKRAFVPQYMSGTRGTTVYGLTSQRVALELVNMRFGVEMLGEPDLPRTTDLFLLRDDLARQSGFLAPQGGAVHAFAAAGADRLLVSATAEGVIAALPGGTGPDTFHFPAARHGHNARLIPDPLLWDAPAATASLAAFAVAQPALSDEAVAAIGQITPAALLHTVERYSGQRSLDGSVDGTTITSRHILSADNERAIDQLVADLQTAGGGRFQIRLQPFSFQGQTLHNIEAELPGNSPELVLVTAHMDSTAASDDHFDPAGGRAPGADDDGSGVAAVLAIAEQFAALTATVPPARTVRFVLFNAEEQGRIGSMAYARRCKVRGEAITAVWQMDMIGFNATPPQTWEIHAGFATSLPVEARSRRLADLLAATAALVTDLPPAQIHHSGTPGGDGADGRSDHTSFQAQGYAACVVTEDFFLDGPGAAAPDMNPHYHRAADLVVDPDYAAALTRAVAAAAWLSTLQGGSPNGLTTSFSSQELTMPASRKLDTRTRNRSGTPFGLVAPAPLAPSRTNAVTGSPTVVPGPVATAADKPLIERALAFVQRQSASFGVGAGQVAEFFPDPNVQRTNSGSAAVNLKQHYRGLTVFQMSRTVRFGPTGQLVDAAGDTAGIAEGLDIEPKLSADAAVLLAAKHLASTGAGETVRDMFGRETPAAQIDIKEFQPEVISGFPLPSRPTVFAKGPFENPIPAYLLIFQSNRSRLAWHVILTFPDYADQFVVLVAADTSTGEVLFCKSTMQRALGRGRVYEFAPAEDGSDNRQLIDFPRPLGDYPVMPTTPLSGFPHDWVATTEARGNSTRATLNNTATSLPGVPGPGGRVIFDPADPVGDDQKLLNIFYYCNYMHDFLFILGFDEGSGNFQQTNFSSAGAGGDPVRARAHSGAVFGTANMSTPADGLPPLMNMGMVVSTDRHTAFDADVVFHEYIHGLTNRLVGGWLDTFSLDALQSGGMGEGWSDYFALTLQNFFRTAEKVVVGDWVVANSQGIRRHPYDDAYPFGYDDLASSPEEHDIGEVWCAALMMMTRRLRRALGDDQQGYRLAWQFVVDGLKQTQANPTFLEARDMILRAIQDMSTANRISSATHQLARRAAWEAFAHFGMGAGAISDDANDVASIVADNTIPPGV